MFNPVSTYRIQFHKDFTFNDLDNIIPYLADLGIKTLYASPIFKAVPGSTHGYDSVDPTVINPEIGTLEQLRSISARLKEHGISWLQDIVPNHMAFHQDNLWLMDVLEKGPLSAYKDYFDQGLTGGLYQGPIMVPFLGDDLDNIIANGDLKVQWKAGKLVFDYFGQIWPLNLRAYTTILEAGGDGVTDAVKQLLSQISEANEIDGAQRFSQAAEEINLQLASLSKNKEFEQYLTTSLENINNDKAALQALANAQYYRLCNWKETDKQINYRRFFTVNGLICLNIQREEVFNHVHQLVNEWLKDGTIQGLRIDHIDGLYDPAQYLQRLRDLAGDEAYIVIEKILEHGEELPENWPIQGSTGYEFLAYVNNLFTNRQSEKAFTKFYKKLTDDDQPVAEQIRTKKGLILSDHMNGELENLTRLFIDLDLYEGSADVAEDIKQAIGRLLVNFPVYRFYGNALPLNEAEAHALSSIFKKIEKNHPEVNVGTGILKQVLLENPREGDEEYNQRALHFYQRCMQFSGPLMAKGVEDTLMYTYNRFIDHNEVGDSPEAFGMPVKEFHKIMQQRQQQWPLALNATATHDTKRGEGVRARLNVLSSMPDEWLQAVTEWQQLNQDLKTNGAPDQNDEYFIYQTLIGAYPMPGQPEDDFGQRLKEYIEKTLREAKLHSNWSDPNEAYETGVKNFAAALLDKERPFWKSFEAFHQKVSDFGVSNSLAQAALKLTCPGIPDIYQGCEHWDLSLVDPDNRRPVDYEMRRQLLGEATSDDFDIDTLWENRFNGQIKVWLVNKLLRLRNKRPAMFSKGMYVPLQVKGTYKHQVIAFARVYKGTWMVVIVPLDTAGVCKADPQAQPDWDNTRVLLPANAPVNFVNVLTSESGTHQQEIALKDTLTRLPLAILRLKKPASSRNAGVLMHITSLPSLFGIGDFGPQARHFADMLNRSYQKYWQILPMNATGEADGYSPYSAYSSHAGNTLLISPQLLAEEGLLTAMDLKQAYVTETGQVDFKAAEQSKAKLLDIAFKCYKNGGHPDLEKEFDKFCNKESAWLDDFALFELLKRHHNVEPWYKWDEEFKFRDEAALTAFGEAHAADMERVKWLQFIFAKQWLELKAYCNQLEINVFGDLPFYISYNSVDVWTNPDIFSLDENLELKTVCGVPPDYFNEDGQRWGMPIFNWEKLKETNYDWWVKRIRRNLEWYDTLRLDHFRAFAAYWEIPANEETAVNGKWVEGPRSDFFNALKTAFGRLPFVAEDLGDIDQPVYDLRDEFNLPGMKVLQFAFGDDMPHSAYIPHYHAKNYFVYTGTHDNNTTRGWYDTDAGSAAHKNISKYTGLKVTAKNVHKVMVKTAMASVCKTAIIPIQDWLGLDGSARMNTPAGSGDNWVWQLTSEQLLSFPEKKAKKWTVMFDRI